MATLGTVPSAMPFRPERRSACAGTWHLPERRAPPAAPLPPGRHELEALFVSVLPTIEEMVTRVASQHRMAAPDREDFDSEVKLALLRDDYRILRRFQGRCTLRTYLYVVVQRLLVDYRRRSWGTWRPSVAARRLGPAASRLEALVHRDGRSVQEAIEVVRCGGPSATSTEALLALAKALPSRGPRRHADCELPMDLPAGRLASPDAMLDGELAVARIQAVVTEVVGSLDDDDRRLVRLRFEDGLSVAEIARSLRLQPKRLYRRLERLVASFRRAVARRGPAWPELRRALEEGQCHLDLRAAPRANEAGRTRRPSVS
jgi:RNA polymerase sigma factor (sigma-70 family)